MLDRVVVLLSVLCLGVSSQPIPNNQHLFSMAVSRIHHLHLRAQRLFANFESSLQSDDQRQLNKIFLQDFCNSDYIISPIDKHETQRSSVLKLLLISKQLVESWEISSHFLPGGLAERSQISSRLAELREGIQMLITTNQEGAEVFSDSSTLPLAPPFGNFFQTQGGDELQRRSYELLACFKKDMHKVETYLTVAKCRLSTEANCTL
uniref:Somatotropin n=1 Tax=Pseudocaranx dentex TaxID=349646 RepID=SOMA_PSEDN|nr:RecName: Full=Somatotropin; AltName: Full=Growth hormone; Flags: Precursor [Pseudocaranx dentex]CAA38961.1 growth hormone [Pseudocaranx dentex]